MSIFTKEFWLESTERAIKTLAQTFLALDMGDAFNLLNIDWPNMLGVAGGAAFLSYCTSIVSASITKRPSPSLVKEPDA
jgi:hypothetical protein